MADFDFINPTVGGSTNNWGVELNAILDILKDHPGIKVVADSTERLSYEPLIGQIIYQTDTDTLYKYNGSYVEIDVAEVFTEAVHALSDHSGIPGVGVIASNSKEVKITTTEITNIATRTLLANCNVIVGIYFRVVVASTFVTVLVTYVDMSGEQTNILLNRQACAVGSYSLVPLFINAEIGDITVSILAETEDQVYGSASILEVG